MRAGIAPSSGSFDPERRRLSWIIGFGFGRRRETAVGGDASGAGGLEIGREWPAQMTLGRVGGAINRTRIGKRRCMMRVA